MQNKKFWESFSEFMELGGEFVRISNRYIASPEEIREQLPFQQLKLSGKQGNILFHLLDDGPMSMTELSKRESTYKQALTQPVLDLVKKGLVNRFQKDGNFRSIFIELTEAGRTAAEGQNVIRKEFLEERMQQALTLEEMQHTTQAMSYVVKALQKLKQVSDNSFKQPGKTE